MLTRGDLVRIPQNSIIFRDEGVVKTTRKPEIGIVLNVHDTICAVLINEKEWAVKSKDLRLYGGSSVYKAS